MHRYTLYADGRLVVDNDIAFSGADVTGLARAGVRLDLVAGYENLTYFGRGPVENYPDSNRRSLRPATRRPSPHSEYFPRGPTEGCAPSGNGFVEQRACQSPRSHRTSRRL